jgi:hypothetical protein
MYDMCGYKLCTKLAPGDLWSKKGVRINEKMANCGSRRMLNASEISGRL